MMPVDCARSEKDLLRSRSVAKNNRDNLREVTAVSRKASSYKSSNG
jgi:hypothetical protein